MPSYRGRFAPSPTGPLHAGSLVAAVGSYLAARRHPGGEWLVRMEDVDTPRTVPGADAEILRCLEACGLEWDGEVVYQSSRFDAYQAALDQLTRDGFTYPCACSRKEAGEGVYPGTCRQGIAAGRRSERAIRFRVPSPGVIEYTDGLCGPQREDVEQAVGDFVLFRADGLWAYQLAVVVDDGWQGITHIVRGADLLDSTPRQIALQRALGIAAHPAYLHLPVVCGPDGQKLSKQTRAAAVDYQTRPGPALAGALAFLGQPTPPEMERWSPREILAHAAAHFTLGEVPTL